METALVVDGARTQRGGLVPEAPDVSVIILVLGDTSPLIACLDSLREHLPSSVRVEILVLANGTPLTALGEVQDRDDVVLIRSAVNHGFGGGCNWAARHARAPRLVFLNDDATITSGWLEHLISTLDSAADIAVVGSRVVLGNGRLQEAGSVIWQEGTTSGVGRGDDPDRPQHLVRRSVDYVSFCSAMVRREAWEAAGGFDEGYFPAYYEDADLCLTLHRRGWKIIYEPMSVVHHSESASTRLRFRHFISARNRGLFTQKWRDALATHEPEPSPEGRPAAVRRALRRVGGDRSSLLLIDDCEPDPALGAGFGRMHDAVVELSRDFDVSFLASYLTVPSQLPWLARRREVTRAALGALGVELHVGDGARVVRESSGVDAVLLSRPTNYEALHGAIAQWLPRAPLIYDTESLWHRRLYRQAKAAHGADERRLRADAERFEAVERAAIRRAEMVLCLTEEEAVLVREIRGDDRVATIPVNLVDIEVTRGEFFDRAPEMLFVASWLAGRDSPNLAGLHWMVDEVLPLIRERFPWVRLIVTGANPPDEVSVLDGPSIVISGFVPDIAALYARARVVVCPLLAGAGVKVKVVEALQAGVPTVATTVGAEGIDTLGHAALAVEDDPREFAARCVALLGDRGAWDAARSETLRFADSRLQHRRAAGTTTWTSVVSAALASRPMGRLAGVGS